MSIFEARTTIPREQRSELDLQKYLLYRGGGIGHTKKQATLELEGKIAKCHANRTCKKTAHEVNEGMGSSMRAKRDSETKRGDQAYEY